jgi:malate dehydrogenase (oxaloacetate-decarboxylating)
MPPISVESAMALGRDVYHGHGKIEIMPKVVVTGEMDIATAFTPGVGHVVRAIVDHPELVHEQTAKDNLIALVTDGTGVLGYGNVGPYAGMPVMEGKAVMFKLLAGIDCMPLCLDVGSGDELVSIIRALEPTFGGFNLEDVAAPRCFEVMGQLDGTLGVPIMHDDQYGTATAIMAALINALRVLDRRPSSLRTVVCGCGAAGTACIELLKLLGVEDILVVDRAGIISRDDDLPFDHWKRIASVTNERCLKGDLARALKGADLFIGLSVSGIVSREMIQGMNKDPIVFSLANPVPEIMPDEALAAGAKLVASGRFDFPNHCNNVLAFPSLLRGALDTKALRVSTGMCMAAARAIAACVDDNDLALSNISPSPMLEHLYPETAEATARAAIEEGLARITPEPGAVAANTRKLRGLAHEWQQVLSRHNAAEDSLKEQVVSG